MGYKSSPFKMAPKSPMLKALKGNQGKLPQQLQDAIKAAPESPAKQTKKREQDYIVAQNKKADKKSTRKNDIKDGQTASSRLKQDMMPRTDANFNKAKAKATNDRLARYGFPENVESKSPAKQTKEYSDKGTKLRSKAEKASAKGRDKKAAKLNTKADKYDKKQVSGLMGSLEKGGAFNTKSPAKSYKK